MHSDLRMMTSKGDTMNKSELVEAIAQGSGVTKADANRVLDMFISTVTDVLKAGDQLVLTGFCSLSVGNRPQRQGRDPRTGNPITIKASRVVKFKTGKLLKEAVQHG
jgi:DNA-binding protein HU-beta